MTLRTEGRACNRAVDVGAVSQQDDSVDGSSPEDGSSHVHEPKRRSDGKQRRVGGRFWQSVPLFLDPCPSRVSSTW